MLILTIRTDKPEAELDLYDKDRRLAHKTWQAHRQLAESIHSQIKDLLQSQDKSLDDLGGIAVFHGPGSFTGLRIGISVANALADGLGIPIVGSGGEDWISEAISKLSGGANEKIILPEYGASPHTSQPKNNKQKRLDKTTACAILMYVKRVT